MRRNRLKNSRLLPAVSRLIPDMLAAGVWSGELRFPIYKKLLGVAFLDFGNVYPKIHNLDPGQFKYAAGAGLRYRTPIGPVGIDLAFPLNPIDPSSDKWQVHFTIGQAF